jgi:predicted dehydrogenase
MIRIGVLDYGYWGPNVTRNFHSRARAEVAMVCDRDERARGRLQKLLPTIPFTTNADEILASPKIDAVAVVTPVSTHFELAKKALENGKHIFIEKPFTQSSAQAEELIELAERKKLQIMVDHTFLFTGAVRKIRQMVEEGSLGELYYYDALRVNLGLFQHDVNVIWDLAPHDLSIMDHLIRSKPEAVVATGARHFNNLEDIAFITVYFPNKVIAHVNVNCRSTLRPPRTVLNAPARAERRKGVDHERVLEGG